MPAIIQTALESACAHISILPLIYLVLEILKTAFLFQNFFGSSTSFERFAFLEVDEYFAQSFLVHPSFQVLLDICSSGKEENGECFLGSL